MQPTQIDLVQQSFKSVLPIKEVAADLFYKRLFELDPSLEHLFSGDMEEQGQKLMSAIGLVVGGLKSLEKILPTVQQLGERHVAYGVKPEHYITVGAALIWTLREGLGEAFTAEVQHAWTDAYEAIATTMMDAAEARAA
jgi:nitric oxide dioxygenase